MFPKIGTRNNSNNINGLNNIIKYLYKFTIWHRLCSNKLKNFEKEVKVKEKKDQQDRCG